MNRSTYINSGTFDRLPGRDYLVTDGCPGFDEYVVETRRLNPNISGTIVQHPGGRVEMRTRIAIDGEEFTVSLPPFLPYAGRDDRRYVADRILEKYKEVNRDQRLSLRDAEEVTGFSRETIRKKFHSWPKDEDAYAREQKIRLRGRRSETDFSE